MTSVASTGIFGISPDPEYIRIMSSIRRLSSVTLRIAGTLELTHIVTTLGNAARTAEKPIDSITVPTQLETAAAIVRPASTDIVQCTA